MMALAANSRTGPEDLALVSKRTAREDYMKLRDPDAEERKVLEEKAMSLPPIQISQMVQALVDAGKDDLARDLLALLSPQQGQPQGGQPQGQQGGEMTAGQLVQMLASDHRTAQLAQIVMQAMEALKQGGAQPGQPPPQGGVR